MFPFIVPGYETCWGLVWACNHGVGYPDLCEECLETNNVGQPQTNKDNMPLTFVVSSEDMLRQTVLDPGWYMAEVKKVSQETAADGQSTNTWIDFVVLSGPKQKDGSEPNNVPVRRCFSEKAPGFIVPFLKACGTQVSKSGGSFDIEKAKGQKMKIYVKNREWNGAMQNDVADFQAAA